MIPWYIIAWRALWIGPAFLFLTLSALFLFLGWGPSYAREFCERELN